MELWGKGLAANQSLTMLGLSNNWLHLECSCDSFASALQRNTALKTLNLSKNSIDDSGILKISNAVSQKATLTHLD